MAEETYLQQTQQLLPEYQESFLKSLLFSAFDPYGGYVTDAQGNVLREGRQGDALAEGESFVSQPTGLATESPLSTVPEQTLAKFGYKDPQTGEVSYSGFTPSQTAALQLGVGQIGGGGTGDEPSSGGHGGTSYWGGGGMCAYANGTGTPGKAGQAYGTGGGGGDHGGGAGGLGKAGLILGYYLVVQLFHDQMRH